MNNDLANYLVGENMENNAKLKHWALGVCYQFNLSIC